ncbi:hypothetical protein TI05_00315 [Achromatium sp. WMS3]|nr:hypothetical protein TI05_00315 [Achromatium sp. WMS3]
MILQIVNSPPQLQYPLFNWNKQYNILYINPYYVIQRIQHGKNFETLDKAGFAHDIQTEKLYERAWIGGRILDNTETDLKRSVAALKLAIDQTLDDLSKEQGFTFGKLVIPDAAGSITASIKKFRLNEGFFANQITLSEAELKQETYNQTHNQLYNQQSLARVITSLEKIHSGKEQKVSKLITSINRILQNQEYAEADIRDICQDIKETAKYSKSQLNRFLDFLDQEALSRVRLLTTFHIMSAIAEEVHSKTTITTTDMIFINYVKRAQAILRLYSHSQAPDLDVKLSGVFDIEDFTLNEEWVKTGFYGCLPVWASWDAQLFEAQPSVTQPVFREISYRFRINGLNPNSDQNKPAFEARLDRIAEVLLTKDATPNPYRIKKALAELIFLSQVFSNQILPSTQAELETQIQKTLINTIQWLENDWQSNIFRSIDTLRSRAGLAIAVSETLIKTLKNPTQRLFLKIFDKSLAYSLNITKDLINLERLSGGDANFLDCNPKPSDEKIHFFKCLEIIQESAATSNNPGQYLLSIRVQVKLQERSLIPTGANNIYKIRRQLPLCLTQIIWRPFQANQYGNQQVNQNQHSSNRFLLAPRIELYYPYDYLAPTQNTNAKTKDLLAAFRIAFGILCYIAVERLLVRLQTVCKMPLNVTALRLQEYGIQTTPRLDDKLTNAEWQTNLGKIATETVYAVSHALEFILGQKFNFKIQGFAVKAGQYKEHNTLAGLYSGLPLEIKTDYSPNLEQVGIITLAARICDRHPVLEEQIYDTKQRQYILLAHVYLLEKTQDRYVFKAISNRSRIVSNKEALEQSSLVPEIIDSLSKQGCNHILYIVHRFEDRRVGRSDIRLRLHDNPDFLNQLNTAFPDIFLYPLVRDVFPAFRFTKQQRLQPGIEITHVNQFEAIRQFNNEFVDQSIYSRYVPIYALGTLKFVGKQNDSDKRPQSGCCTYFFLDDQRVSDRERTQRLSNNMVLPESPIHADLLMALRALHFFEVEQRPQNGIAFPVLDPYSWMHPTCIQAIGDIEYSSSQKHKSVILSFNAILSRVAAIIDSL